MSAVRARGMPPASPAVLDLVRVRIERALTRRARYRYVHPHVEREGAGWKIVSPNCSRNVDPAGGAIDIAWLAPVEQGLWQVHARDHAAAAWVRAGGPQPLDAALAQVCDDPDRRFWP